MILNGFITPALAKKRKPEPAGEDNGGGHAEYFESLVNRASLQQLGAWLVDLPRIEYRDHAPYSNYSDGLDPDPLFETAARWGLDVESIKPAVSAPAKASRAKARRGEKPAAK